MLPEPEWLTIARELQGLAQTGIAFTQDPYDRIRYERLQEIAAEVMAMNLSQRERFTGVSRAGEGSSRTEAPHPSPLPLGEGDIKQTILDIFRREKGYTTPKVGVRGAVFRNDKILMVRGTVDGKWTIPCGYADVNQSAAECAEREIWEESGYTAKAIKLAAVWDYRLHNYPPHPFHHYMMFFICELTGGSPQISDETDAVEFFDESELPELSTMRCTESQITRMFAHYRHPDLATEFD